MANPAEPEDEPALAGAPTRRAAKSASAFRTISEVASELDVPQHVLRFWETRFSQIRPLKRAGGRRYYRPEDVELLRRIRALLYQHGYTIKGVQKLLRDGGRVTEAPRPLSPSAEEIAEPHQPAEAAEQPAPDKTQAISAAIDELVELRDLLRAHKH